MATPAHPSLPFLKPPSSPWYKDSNDVEYLSFFVFGAKTSISYFDIFTNLAADIFARAVASEELYHTVLMVSHFILDNRSGRSLLPARLHQTKAFELLQNSLSVERTTETVATSVALLAWTSINRCNPSAAFQHLHGLHLLIQALRKRSHCDTGTINTFIYQIWKLSLRLETIARLFFFPRKSISNEFPAEDRRPISPAAEVRETGFVDAAIGLDDLFRRVLQAARESFQLRQVTDFAETEISVRTQKLLDELVSWRTVIDEAVPQSVISPDTLRTSGSCYDRLQVENPLHTVLLNSWRVVYILIDLIADPRIGRGNKDSKRLDYAVEISRSLAGLGQSVGFGTNRPLWVFLAGVALGGRRASPVESRLLYHWIDETMYSSLPTSRWKVVRIALLNAFPLMR